MSFQPHDRPIWSKYKLGEVGRTLANVLWHFTGHFVAATLVLVIVGLQSLIGLFPNHIAAIELFDRSVVGAGSDT